jgi:hypothetical protein
LRELADQWEVIREEFLALDAPVLDIHRVGKSYEQVQEEVIAHIQGGGTYGWLKGFDRGAKENPDWVQYGLVVNDTAVPFASATMPKTLALLSKIDGIRVCGLARMNPHTFLPTHRHPKIHTDGLLQYHITLDAPLEGNYAYLNVNGEFNQNVNGDAIVFDGSLDHFALNASEEPRTILHMEFKISSLKAN